MSAFKFEIETQGFAELERALDQFPERLQRKLLRRSLRRASVPIRTRARELAPVDTGLLRREIKILSVRPDAEGRMTAKIGIRRPRNPAKALRAVRGAKGVKKRRVVNDPFYGRFLERGTAKMSARPFLRPALDGAGPGAVQLLGQELADEVRQLQRELSQ